MLHEISAGLFIYKGTILLAGPSTTNKLRPIMLSKDDLRSVSDKNEISYCFSIGKIRCLIDEEGVTVTIKKDELLRTWNTVDAVKSITAIDGHIGNSFIAKLIETKRDINDEKEVKRILASCCGGVEPETIISFTKEDCLPPKKEGDKKKEKSK